MKLVTNDGSSEYLNGLKKLLEDKGIPAYVSGENTARAGLSILSRLSLWVYIDEQHYDASQLLFNPHHMVSKKIDVDEFYKSQPDKVKLQATLNSSLLKLVFTILLFMAGVFVSVRIIDSILL